jgi:hypothetical protein
VYASDHVFFVAFGRKRLSRYQSRISVRRIGRQRVRLVHFAGFVLVEQGGHQLRRFSIDCVTQQRLDVRPVRVRIHRARYQGAVQRHVHPGKQFVKEIIELLTGPTVSAASRSSPLIRVIFALTHRKLLAKSR